MLLQRESTLRNKKSTETTIGDHEQVDPETPQRYHHAAGGLHRTPASRLIQTNASSALGSIAASGIQRTFSEVGGAVRNTQQDLVQPAASGVRNVGRGRTKMLASADVRTAQNGNATDSREFVPHLKGFSFAHAMEHWNEMSATKRLAIKIACAIIHLIVGYLTSGFVAEPFGISWHHLIVLNLALWPLLVVPAAGARFMESETARTQGPLGLVFVANALSAMHFGLIFSFAVYSQTLAGYYGLESGAVAKIYLAMILGAYSLHFLPGAVFDTFGSKTTLVVGFSCTMVGLALAQWSSFLFTGFFLFGLGAGFYTFSSLLSVLKAFPSDSAGLASCGINTFIALGIVLQTTMFRIFFSNDFRGFLEYVVFYSFLAAMLPYGASEIVEDGQATEEEADRFERLLSLRVGPADQPASGFSTLFHFVGSSGSKNSIFFQRSHNMFSSSALPANDPKLLRHILGLPMFWLLLLIFAHAVAFSFSLFGVVSRMSLAIGEAPGVLARLVGLLGVSFALGKVAYSAPGDFLKESRFINGKLFLALDLGLYLVALLLLRISLEQYLWIGAPLAIFAFGGLLGLAPGVIAEAFGPEHIWSLMSILYEVAAFAFVLWHLAAPTDVIECKEICFKGWLTRSAVLMAASCLFAVEEYLRSIFQKESA